MFNSEKQIVLSTRPTRELAEVAALIETMELKSEGYRFGARQAPDGSWRIMLQIDALEWDVLLPKAFGSLDEAYNAAYNLAIALGGVPRVKGAMA